MVMMNEPSIEGAAMFSKKTSKPGTSNPGNMKLNLKDKENCRCSHCMKSSHNNETCFTLHGKKKTLNRLAEIKG